MRELKIADKIINDESDCFVIAEIGHNHQGNIETAKEMIAAASLAGANAVKFQKRDNRMLFTKEMYDSPYTNRNSYGSTYGKHRDALEFNMEQYSEMQAFAKRFCEIRGAAIEGPDIPPPYGQRFTTSDLAG